MNQLLSDTTVDALICAPAISGILWNIGRNGFRDGMENYRWTAGQWQEELDLIQRAGIDTILLNGTYFSRDQRNDNLPPHTGGDLLLFLLEETQKRGILVILETYVSAPDWESSASIAEEIRENRGFIKYLNRKYGQFDNFYAWYIGYEACVRTGSQEKIIRRLYREVARMCHEQSPHRPVMISPFYMLDDKRVSGPVEFYPPEFYVQWWGETLTESEIDILALQDSGAEHIAGTTIEDRRPFFQAMRTACENSGTRFWGNVETAEVKVWSFEEYAEKFGWGTWVNQPIVRDYWKAVDVDKLADKLELAAQYCEKIISWGWREFVRPGSDSDNRRLYENYLEYRKRAVGR